VQNSELLVQVRQLAGQLQTALASQAVIDQATGVLMSREGCPPGEAFDRLQAMSRTQHQPLSAVAGRLLDEADVRARSRESRRVNSSDDQPRDQDRRPD
jgi:AmiR/NasT family two-component response regulator